MPRPGTREGLARNDFLGQAEFPTDRSHLVLEQQPKRLDEFELQVVGQSADVVMALDVRSSRATAGLHHIGIQRALHQEIDLRSGIPHDLSDSTLEGTDELPADDLALALRVGHPGECLEESVGDVDGDQVGAGRGDEITLYLRPFPGPQQSMVDEYAGQPVADGPLHQCGGHRGVHPAGQTADRPPVADLVAHLLDECVGDVRRRPARVDTGEFVQEPAEYLLAVRGVHDLGVVLHSCQALGPILERCDGCAGTGRRPRRTPRARR